jgi:hypothetical protein
MMKTGPSVGDRVRVRPSGETGQITQIAQAADGRTTYQVEFDRAASEASRQGSGETGGLYVLEDIEPIR